jgi:SAM-dependent methyltransferase
MNSQRFIPKAGLEERIEAVLDIARGRNVLHVGMGGLVDDVESTSRYVLRDLTLEPHGRLARVAASLMGLDVNPVVIEAMRRAIPGDYFVGDIGAPGLAEKLNRKFDVVLFLEVVEHLDSFHTAFDNLRGLLAPNGVLVVSTINAYCIERFIKMMFRYESVHTEHTTYFSYKTMKRLLEMNDFPNTEHFAFTLERRRHFANLFDRAGYYTLRAATAFFPQYAEGILFAVRPGRSSMEQPELAHRARLRMMGPELAGRRRRRPPELRT